MKSLLKTEDGPMDRLLRGHLAPQPGPKQICKQFDPDLANAYIEHSLTATEREGFDRHLSLCGDCRSATVVLVRLAASEAPASPATAGHQATEGWLERLGALAAAMKTPRWAMAATAVLVAAISIPIFMSQVSNRADRASVAAPQFAAEAPSTNRASETEKQPESKPAVAAGAAELSSATGRVAQNPAPRSNQTPIAAGASGGVGSQQPTTGDTDRQAAEKPAVAAAKNSGEQDQKKEQAAASAVATTIPSRDQLDQVAPGSQQAPSQQQQQTAGVDQLAKVDREGPRPASEAAKDSAHVSVLKSGRPDGEERAAGGTKIRPEDNNAPASPIAGAESGARRALSQPSASSLRDGKLNVSGRSRGTAERKIGKKRFWLRDEVWTDNDYKPEKEMPMVTLVRDSDVFKEVIGKRPTLKGYLTSFTETERAIVVYKGTIYKLIPQDGSK
ncbi:MAG: zf-HC2 domain-containing protein [Acidobacteriota bacterium]